MSESYEIRRQQLLLQQMEADIAAKRADAALREERRKWEPWWAIAAIFAVAALSVAVVVASAWLIR